MRYEVFEKGSLQKDPEYPSDVHMQRVIREAVMPSAQEAISLNESLSPSFLFCSWEDKLIRLLYHNRPWMLNTNGHMHGGMIASVCDMTMGLLSRYVKGTNKVVTVSLNIDYLRGISADEDIMVEAKVEKAGKNIVFLSAKVYRMSDVKMAASAMATFM